MPQLKVTLAENLKRFLADRRMTQRELAEKIGVSLQTISVIANAKSGLTPDTLAKIASALNVEETDLVAVQKPAEKVEVPKAVWEWIARQNSLSGSLLPSGPFGELKSIPYDILKELFELDPESQETAWMAIRAVIAGLKGNRDSKKSETG